MRVIVTLIACGLLSGCGFYSVNDLNSDWRWTVRYGKLVLTCPNGDFVMQAKSGGLFWTHLPRQYEVGTWGYLDSKTTPEKFCETTK